MIRTLLIVLILAALVYVVVCAAMYGLQRSLMYYPRPRAADAADSMLRLPVDGAELVISVRPHAGPKAIVYFGGNGEDVSQNLASFSEAFPEHAIYLMHYRGYGGSTGKPTEAAIVADALVLFEKVQAAHPEVSLMGRSLGSGVAIQVASRASASRLVLITPFDSIVEIAAQLYPWLPVRWLVIDTYRSGDFAPRITVPTTLIEAEKDQEIPHASTAKLLRRFNPGIATLMLIEGAGHNGLGGNSKYLETLQAALR